MDVKEQTRINTETYAVPPTWEQISEVIKESGMTMYHFERFFGIPYNVLTQVKSGKRNLPPMYWHFIYEKAKPNYGVGYVKYNLKNENKEVILKDYHKKLKKNSLTVPLTPLKHNRLGTIYE